MCDSGSAGRSKQHTVVSHAHVCCLDSTLRSLSCVGCYAAGGGQPSLVGRGGRGPHLSPALAPLLGCCGAGGDQALTSAGGRSDIAGKTKGHRTLPSGRQVPQPRKETRAELGGLGKLSRGTRGRGSVTAHVVWRGVGRRGNAAGGSLGGQAACFGALRTRAMPWTEAVTHGKPITQVSEGSGLNRGRQEPWVWQQPCQSVQDSRQGWWQLGHCLYLLRTLPDHGTPPTPSLSCANRCTAGTPLMHPEVERLLQAEGNTPAGPWPGLLCHLGSSFSAGDSAQCRLREASQTLGERPHHEQAHPQSHRFFSSP